MAFTDRTDAGRQLADRLQHLRASDSVALGLPRGGVPVAAEVSHALGIPLDVIVVRKLGVPYQPELAMGAVGEGGVRVVNDDVIRIADVSDETLQRVEDAELAELSRRSARFRQGRDPVPLDGRTAIVIDDGIATGATARAACQIARAHGARSVVLAVPIAPPDAVRSFQDVADEVVCVASPAALSSIGQWYQDFTQTPDEEVTRLLDEAASRRAVSVGSAEVAVLADGVQLTGELTVPRDASGVVVFAHGTGSGRASPRNVRVAQSQHDAGLATLLFDLLTPGEAADRTNVFDIALLAKRVLGAIRWIGERSDVGRLPLGLFGASTGAAAALWAAAEAPSSVTAVVSRGGRPDLAADRLGDVTAPTLLIVGGADAEVLELNRRAQSLLVCRNRLETVPGATHLFEEPGAMDTVARLAADWFGAHLGGS